MAPGVGEVHVGVGALPLEFHAGFVVLGEGAVQLGHHERVVLVRQAEGLTLELVQHHVQVGDVVVLGDAGRRGEHDPGTVVGVFPEVHAVPVAAVEASAQAIAEVLGGADEELIRVAGLHVRLPELAGGGGVHRVIHLAAGGVEVDVDGRGQVAVPGGGAGQGGHGGDETGVVGVDRVFLGVVVGDAQAGLQGIGGLDFMLQILVAAGLDIARDRAGILAEARPVELVVADDQAHVEGELVPLDLIVELVVQGLVFRVDGGHPGDPLLVHGCHKVVGGQGVGGSRGAGRVGANRGDEAPAVGDAVEIFHLLGPLDPGVEGVGHRGAPGGVVGQFVVPAEEVLVVDLVVAADIAAARGDARAVQEAILGDEWRDEGVIGGLGGGAGDRHLELALRVQGVHVQVAGEGGHGAGEIVRMIGALEDEVGGLEVEEAVGGHIPGGLQGRDLHLGVAALAGGVRVGGAAVARVVDRVIGVPQAGVDQDVLGRGVGQLAEVFLPGFRVVGGRPLVVGAVLLADCGPVEGEEVEELVRQDGPAHVEDRVGLRLLVDGGRGVVALGHQAVREGLIGELSRQSVGAGLADGVDAVARGAVETHRVGAALADGDLVDVVARRLGGHRSIHGQVDVHTVELVHVVLAAATGAGAADRILGVHDAGDELDQIAIVLAHGEGVHGLGAEGGLELG